MRSVLQGLNRCALITIGSTVAVALSFGCFSALPVSASETVRIAHQTDFAPFVYVKNGKSAGLIIDILNAAAAREGITIIFVPVPFAQLDATLTNGKADAITPLAITPDRKKKYDFSSTLVLTGGACSSGRPTQLPQAWQRFPVRASPRRKPDRLWITSRRPLRGQNFWSRRITQAVSKTSSAARWTRPL
jgi:hypothetical protein